MLSSMYSRKALSTLALLASIGGSAVSLNVRAFSSVAPLHGRSLRTSPNRNRVEMRAKYDMQHDLIDTFSSSRTYSADEKWIEETIQQQHEELQRYIGDDILPLRAPSVSVDSSVPEDGKDMDAEGIRDVNIARLLLLGAAALYGTNFSLVKLLGETDIPVGMSSALRFGMAALATSPWLLPGSSSEPGQQRKISSEEWSAMKLGFEVGVWNSIGYVAQAVGLETTSASKSAFICSLAVVTVPLLDYFVGKTLLLRQSIGALLALAGVAVLELGGLDASEATLTNGDIASLIQPICFGIGFWRMEAAMQKHPDQANRSTAAQLFAVFIVSLGYAALNEASSFDVSIISSWLTDRSILFSLFWTGCISTALTVYMETIALKTLSAAETTLIFSTEPLWGTAFAALVMGETLGWESGVGACLILGGCVFSNLGVDGITTLFQQNQVSGEESFVPASKTAGISLGNSTSFSTKTQNMVTAGAASLVGTALLSVWDDLSTNTKYAALQIEEIVENLF